MTTSHRIVGTALALLGAALAVMSAYIVQTETFGGYLFLSMIAFGAMCVPVGLFCGWSR